MILRDARLLRLYMNINDRAEGKPLYEAVVLKARSMGLIGVSVFTPEIGFGSHREVHDTKSEYGFVGAPVVMEIVESPEHIEDFLDALKALLADRLSLTFTISPVEIYRDVASFEREGS